MPLYKGRALLQSFLIGASGLSCVILFCILAALGFIALAGSGPAAASILVHVDRGSQRMDVIVDGEPRYNWRVSTARRGYITPPGTYHPQRLAVRWYSKKYDNAPMPHSIFFYGGYAIHGTYENSRAGPPGVARLRAARSRQRRYFVRARRARRHGWHHDRSALGTRVAYRASPRTVNNALSSRWLVSKSSMPIVRRT